MPYLTGVVLAIFVAYIGSWFLGVVEGNMALLLFAATIVCGLYWIAEKLYFLPRRRAALLATDAQADPKAALVQPWWLDWTAGLFPVIALVFVLRSFVYEPFRIPSGSMMPTLEAGDLILVNKWTWGLRVPVLNSKLTNGSGVQRGDVMVFRYPPKPNIDYIKRVVGLPGDTIAYLDKNLFINGKAVTKTPLEDYLGTQERLDFSGQSVLRSQGYFQQYQEQLGTHTLRVLNDANRPPMAQPIVQYPMLENCTYTQQGVSCKVPQGHYFVMGDNRDASEDSRFWGFVPEANIVGEAVAVWMNLGNLDRIGAID